MTQEERNDMIAKRDQKLWEQYQLYQSLRPKVICKSWGLTYSGYMQVLFRMKNK